MYCIEAAILLSIHKSLHSSGKRDNLVWETEVFLNDYHLVLPPSLSVCHMLLLVTFDVHFPVVHNSKQCRQLHIPSATSASTPHSTKQPFKS